MKNISLSLSSPYEKRTNKMATFNEASWSHTGRRAMHYPVCSILRKISICKCDLCVSAKSMSVCVSVCLYAC